MDICSGEVSVYIHQKANLRMFTVAFFIIASNLKPKCPLRTMDRNEKKKKINYECKLLQLQKQQQG